MLKWILGGLAVLILVLGGTCWYGYKKVTEGGDTAEVAIAGPQDWVYAALVHTDSMLQWMNPETAITPAGRELAVGDTIRVSGKIGQQGNARQDMMWIVRELTPPSRIVMDMADDSTGQAIIVRHDEIARRNDSTVIMTRFSSPLMDSVRNNVADSSRFAGGMMGTVQKVMVSAMRFAAEADLARLKARVEGKPLP
jgi:uncharacterized protein YndB with AHSA1/START domain